MSAVLGVERTATGPHPRPGPIDDDERLHALDILRGFALFGMILVHFHQAMRVETTGIEDLIGWAVYVLVEQKAWGIFAFLFGAGFAILLRRLDARQSPVAATYLRRLAALAALGVIAEVGFGFRILFTYACWGVALVVVRRWSTRALLLTALVAVVARPLATEVSVAWASWTGSSLTPPASLSLRHAVDLAAEQSTYRELLAARWALFAATTPGSWRGLLPDMNFSLFVLGLLAVPVGHAGRMALTNYMLQAILLDVLASAYGAGLRLRPLVYAFASVSLFAAEAGLSTLWLAAIASGRSSGSGAA